jgi:AraC-like DNA-binding protein
MRLQAQARLSRLLADWLSSTIEQHVADHDPMRDVEHEARRRIPTGFNVADMAVHCGMSRARFTLAYQKDRGQSPGAFLRKLRLEIAQELLTDPSWSIKRIAHHVGYQSAVTFARAFHAEYNCSPQQWRNRNQA